jgi:hypothetical protein
MITMKAVIALVAGSIFSFAASANAQGYDVNADYLAGYSAGSNPNGVWSYGWIPSLTGPLTLYANTGVLPYGNNGFDMWYDPTFGMQQPSIYKNVGGYYSDANIDIPAGALILHGRSLTSGSDFSSALFTAPTSGTYDLSTTFTGCQPGELASVYVLDNGATLFGLSVGSLQSQNYSTSLNLAAGDVVTFAVGYVDNASTAGDSVALDATITEAPEPTSLALLMFGGVALALRPRSTRR